MDLNPKEALTDDIISVLHDIDQELLAIDALDDFEDDVVDAGDEFEELDNLFTSLQEVQDAFFEDDDTQSNGRGGDGVTPNSTNKS
ncbi:unnamed protein product, partial [marine sediment metagenome]